MNSNPGWWIAAAAVGLINGYWLRSAFERWRAGRWLINGKYIFESERIGDMTWELGARPEGYNDKDRNEGGLVFFLRHTSRGYNEEEEIGRVAFERSNALDPNVSFDDKVDEYVAAGRKAIEVISELTANAGTLT